VSRKNFQLCFCVEQQSYLVSRGLQAGKCLGESVAIYLELIVWFVPERVDVNAEIVKPVLNLPNIYRFSNKSLQPTW
jgi:hypothetical protein